MKYQNKFRKCIACAFPSVLVKFTIHTRGWCHSNCFGFILANVYLFKVNNVNTRKRCETYSMLTPFLVFLLLTLNK